MGVTEEKNDITVQNLGLNIYPNPTHSVSIISYSLAKTEDVFIVVYDAAGREIRSLLSAKQTGGSYTIHWDGCDVKGDKVQPGVYFVHMHTKEECVQAKLVLLN